MFQLDYRGGSILTAGERCKLEQRNTMDDDVRQNSAYWLEPAEHDLETPSAMLDGKR